MAEIRVRDANPKLIDQLAAISDEVKEATIAGTLEKMIPRYHDMKKRIKEQNDEIAKLSREVNRVQYKESTLNHNFERFIDGLKDTLTTANRDAKTFGTKRKVAARKKPAPATKIVPSPKKKK